MKGARLLNNNEIQLVSDCFDRMFEARNRGIYHTQYFYRQTHLRIAQSNDQRCLSERLRGNGSALQ